MSALLAAWGGERREIVEMIKKWIELSGLCETDLITTDQDYYWLQLGKNQICPSASFWGQTRT